MVSVLFLFNNRLDFHNALWKPSMQWKDGHIVAMFESDLQYRVLALNLLCSIHKARISFLRYFSTTSVCYSTKLSGIHQNKEDMDIFTLFQSVPSTQSYGP
jgi:hypothetical protein